MGEYAGQSVVDKSPWARHSHSLVQDITGLGLQKGTARLWLCSDGQNPMMVAVVGADGSGASTEEVEVIGKCLYVCIYRVKTPTRFYPTIGKWSHIQDKNRKAQTWVILGWTMHHSTHAIRTARLGIGRLPSAR